MILQAMAHEFALTKANRLKLAHAFRNTPRVDLDVASSESFKLVKKPGYEYVAIYEARSHDMT